MNDSDDDFIFSFSLQNTFYTIKSHADHLSDLSIVFSTEKCNLVSVPDDSVNSRNSSSRLLNYLQCGTMLGSFFWAAPVNLISTESCIIVYELFLYGPRPYFSGPRP